MTLVQCNKHGLSGLVETCKHVDEELNKGIIREFNEIKLWGYMLVCDTCWKQHDLESFEKHPEIIGKDMFDIEEENPTIDEYFQIYDKIQRVVWCSECLAQIKVKQARNNGEGAPFPVYERTLNSNNGEEIEKLHNLLTENFYFKESIVKNDSFAVFVLAGGYTHPLTIKIYYVSSEIEQKRITQFVDDLFRKKELNQVKIKFLEAEIWTTWSNHEAGISGGKRGKEKLLKEVLLNC